MSEWTWKGIMAEYDALKAERDELKARVERYEMALKDIVMVLGPLPYPTCCEGAQAEMTMAHNIAKQALAEQEGK